MTRLERIRESYRLAKRINRLEEYIYREEMVEACTGVNQGLGYYYQLLTRLVREYESLTGEEW